MKLQGYICNPADGRLFFITHTIILPFLISINKETPYYFTEGNGRENNEVFICITREE